VRRLAALVLGLLVAACGSPAPTTPPLPGGPAAKTAPAPGAQTADAQKLAVPPGGSSGYEAKGRRDPFEVPSAREGVGTVSSAKLTGIIRRANGTALALVETPDGLGYILTPGDTLGEGRLLEIGPNSVVFSVPASSAGGPTSNRVVLKLAGDR
jgi:hypothetical protein